MDCIIDYTGSLLKKKNKESDQFSLSRSLLF